MVNQIVAPPSELIFSVLWLGKGKPPMDVVPIGSGTVIDVDQAEYIATAFHVLQDETRPLVRMDGQWNPSNAEVVAYDETLDVAVLKCPDRLRPAHLSSALTQGIGNLVVGETGVALGFPDVMNIEGTEHVLEHIAEVNGRPVPFPMQTLFYAGESSFVGSEGVIHCPGNTNAGYSGGALAFPIPRTRQWSLAAMITGFPRSWRPLQLPVGSLLAHDGVPRSQEHLGLITAVTMNEIETMVREGRRRSQ